MYIEEIKPMQKSDVIKAFNAQSERVNLEPISSMKFGKDAVEHFDIDIENMGDKFVPAREFKKSGFGFPRE